MVPYQTHAIGSQYLPQSHILKGNLPIHCFLFLYNRKSMIKLSSTFKSSVIVSKPVLLSSVNTQIFREIKCVSGFFSIQSKYLFILLFISAERMSLGLKQSEGGFLISLKQKNCPVYRQKEKGNGDGRDKDGKVDYETQTVGSCRVFLQTGTLIHLKLHWALMMS